MNSIEAEAERDEQHIRNELLFLCACVRGHGAAHETLDQIHTIAQKSEAELPPAVTVERLRHHLRTIWRRQRLNAGSDRWQAPSIRSSLSPREVGDGQSTITSYDEAYLRWTGGDDLSCWECSFANSIVCGLGGSSFCPVVLSTSTGIGALALAVDWLRMRGDHDKQIIVHPRAYFEIKRLFRDARVIDWRELSSLRDAIVVIEPVNNSLQREINAVADLVRRVGPLTGRNIYIVVDRSAHGGKLDPGDYGLDQDELGRVLFTESALKTVQYGLDLVQAGVLVAFARLNEFEDMRRDLRLLRAVSGRTPTELQSLLFLPVRGDLIQARWRRHRRNAALMSDILRQGGDVEKNCVLFCANNEGVYQSPLLSVCPKEESGWGCDRIVEQLMGRMAEQGILLNEGFGFGFNVSRVAKVIDNYGQGDEHQYVRIAVGAEDVETAMLVAHAMVSIVGGK